METEIITSFTRSTNFYRNRIVLLSNTCIRRQDKDRIDKENTKIIQDFHEACEMFDEEKDRIHAEALELNDAECLDDLRVLLYNLMVSLKNVLKDLLGEYSKGAVSFDPNVTEAMKNCSRLSKWILEEHRQIVDHMNSLPTEEEQSSIEMLLSLDEDTIIEEGVLALPASQQSRRIKLLLGCGIQDTLRAKLTKILDGLQPRHCTCKTDGVATQTPITSQQSPSKANKKRQKTFLELVLYKEPKVLIERLHQLIDVQSSGAAIGAILLKAQLDGHIRECPTKEQFDSEFTWSKNWQNIHNYMNMNNLKALEKAAKVIIFKDAK